MTGVIHRFGWIWNQNWIVKDGQMFVYPEPDICYIPTKCFCVCFLCICCCLYIKVCIMSLLDVLVIHTVGYTQPSIFPGSVSEDQLCFGRKGRYGSFR